MVHVYERMKPFDCMIYDDFWINHSLKISVRFGVDSYPICMNHKFSDNPWFSDSFWNDQICH